MDPKTVTYAVISPVRDEEKHLKVAIESVIRQTIRPAKWIIVNDGSTDATGAIIDGYAAQFSWIRALHRPNRGFRKSGGGVVEAFNDGLQAVACPDWEFLVKLDGDLEFEPDYFEKCFTYFAHDPALGIGGGTICYVENGIKRFERTPAFHVRGATKIYRRACWEGLGGLWPAPGWDTLDEVKANMLGWTTRTFDDLHLIHHRLTGSADGFWGGFVKNGRANYISGYHPLYMLAKCLSRLRGRQGALAAMALFYGFISGYFKRLPQVNDPRLIGYLRRQQLNRLCGRETIWR